MPCAIALRFIKIFSSYHISKNQNSQIHQNSFFHHFFICITQNSLRSKASPSFATRLFLVWVNIFVQVRSFPHVPSSGLSPVVPFVPQRHSSRFQLRSVVPFGVVSTRSLPYVRVVPLPCCPLIDLLRFASPKSRSNNSTTPSNCAVAPSPFSTLVGTASPDLFIVFSLCQ